MTRLQGMPRPAPFPISPGQESVWDYPRPPRLEAFAKTLRVELGGQVLAKTDKGFRVLETSHPPVYYFPPEDVRMDLLVSSLGNASNCEWKGQAKYFDAMAGDRRVLHAAWMYAQPVEAFSLLKDYIAFYAGRVDACYVDDELVTPQPGNFYGGWITADLAGPFKGEEGSWGW